MGNATKKSIFDHSFPEKRLLHCQLLSEPKNLQSLLLSLGYVSLERVLLISDQKYFLPNMLLFKNAPENDPYLGNDFFWYRSDGKAAAPSLLVLCSFDKKFSCRVIWSLFGCLVVGCGAWATLTIERLPILYLYTKYMCMCTEEEMGARIRWRISEAGECTSELPELI